MQLIASPLTTITQSESLDFLVEYCKRELVETVVVGQPHRWSGETS
ncbi:MAG: RNase H-fold protein (predicted Holliday junction resolvase), partial [Bacteroidia bacterium]